MEGKNIKVYGTLINLTLNTDSSMRDSQHNDLIAVAYQLFDERFNPKKGSGTNGAVINIDRYQDIINKRLTALSYDPNGDLTSLYSNLYVSGDTNIGGDLTVEGDTTFEGDVNITGDINLNMGLNDLNDVALSTMAIGLVLRYDGSKWTNAKLSIDDLQMPTATNGQVLKFNGTKWVAGTDDAGGGGVSRLSELQDVNISSPENGQILSYDASSGKWKALTTNTNVTSMRVTGDWIIDDYSTDNYHNFLLTCVYSMPIADAQKVLSAVVWFKAKYISTLPLDSDQSMLWVRAECAYGDNFIMNSYTGRVIDKKWYHSRTKTITDGNELYDIVDTNTPPIFLFMISEYTNLA